MKRRSCLLRKQGKRRILLLWWFPCSGGTERFINSAVGLNDLKGQSMKNTWGQRSRASICDAGGRRLSTATWRGSHLKGRRRLQQIWNNNFSWFWHRDPLFCLLSLCLHTWIDTICFTTFFFYKIIKKKNTAWRLISFTSSFLAVAFFSRFFNTYLLRSLTTCRMIKADF